MSSPPKLYSGTRNASSWAMRAWLALREADLAFDEEIVDIRRPQRFGNLAGIAHLTPAGTVPALVTDEGVIFDSLAIMEYANDRSDGRLLPTPPVLRARARSVMAWQHGGLSDLCGRISFESAFYPRKRHLTAREKDECDRLYGVIEQFLAETDGPFICGALSLADLALAPAVIRLTRHRDVPEHLPRARSWAAAVLGRPALQAWMAEADQLEHVWYDDYLVTEPASTDWRDDAPPAPPSPPPSSR